MNSKPILFDKVFIRYYKKRVLPNAKLHKQYKKMLSVFIQNPFHPQLKNHKLKGKMKQYRGFFIDDDCRVVYVEKSDKVLFLDVGKHEEVYK